MALRRKVSIRGMYGLGDSIYQRAFVRQFHGAFLRTPWPELYCDLDVQFVRSNTSLRTQRKNEERTGVTYVREPARPSEVLTIFYGPEELKKGSIVDAMTWQFGKAASVFDLPSYGESPVKADKPIAVIRPATVRKEWANPARNPDPKYLAAAARELRRHFYVVSLADLEEDCQYRSNSDPPCQSKTDPPPLNHSSVVAFVFFWS
ncbi:hypothetical protein [Mixta mediterraneensis]|uniref:hypothetical protein n=1 Tax=Mixta mediterraneensis TaxID=2758443 RepID=UPI001874EA7D|nr:hypothetical protein [Mixta mediterraneensis]MBE5252936.1 hypothetical protein [Mixta mediterraneensis]